jgi:hypothetical protein
LSLPPYFSSRLFSSYFVSWTPILELLSFFFFFFFSCICKFLLHVFRQRIVSKKSFTSCASGSLWDQTHGFNVVFFILYIILLYIFNDQTFLQSHMN